MVVTHFSKIYNNSIIILILIIIVVVFFFTFISSARVEETKIDLDTRG